MSTYPQNDSFEYLVGFHCTPTLAGIKCANLFSLKDPARFDIRNELSRLNRHFNPRGIYLKELCRCPSNILILVYHHRLLCRTLSCDQTQALLAEEGYPLSLGLDALLAHLALRLSLQDDFPHEIGIFLGYPLADVIGFRSNHGKNYKLSGYWKVYGDAQEAVLLFEKFTRCRNNVCSRISDGMSLKQIFKTA